MTDLDLAGIKARAEAATPEWPSPWIVRGDDGDVSVWSSDLDGCGPIASYLEPDAAAHIAGLSPDVALALVAEIKRLREELREAQTEHIDMMWQRRRAEERLEALEVRTLGSHRVGSAP